MHDRINVISVQDVQKTFNSIVAVNRVSFAIDTGKIFGLLGPNGAGKTTPIRLILDLIPPDSGLIQIHKT